DPPWHKPPRHKPRDTGPMAQIGAQNARARCLRQTAGLFRGEALLRQREHAQRASSPRTNSTRRRCATKRNAFCLERRADDVAGAGLVVRRHCLRLAKLRFKIKIKALFSAATACKIIKIVDSQQHDRLKTHKSAA